jgi:hypothetical protein
MAPWYAIFGTPGILALSCPSQLIDAVPMCFQYSKAPQATCAFRGKRQVRFIWHPRAFLHPHPGPIPANKALVRFIRSDGPIPANKALVRFIRSEGADPGSRTAHHFDRFHPWPDSSASNIANLVRCTWPDSSASPSTPLGRFVRWASCESTDSALYFPSLPLLYLSSLLTGSVYSALSRFRPIAPRVTDNAR